MAAGYFYEHHLRMLFGARVIARVKGLYWVL